MKLQILVTTYNEGYAVMKPLLYSLACQQNVPFDEIGVIVCNDGGQHIDVTGDFPYKIEYYDEEHGGVSAARNKALDHASADYVMFCDCDDLFLNACGLWLVFNEMEKGFDCFLSQFCEEVRIEGKPQYITKDFESTFVHGKVFRRAYLVENEIRFDERLTLHEDSYFVCLAHQLAKDVIFCPTPFYLWKWRDTSTCRHDPDYAFTTYPHLLKSNAALIDEFLRRGRREEAEFVATDMMYKSFIKLTERTSKELDDAFKDFYHTYSFLEESTSDRLRAVIVDRRNKEQPIDEQMFREWLNGKTM